MSATICENDVFIISDRGLSPAAARLLKDRILAATQWPNIAALTLPEFTKKLLRHLRIPYALMNEREKVFFLLEKLDQFFPEQKIPLSSLSEISGTLDLFFKLELPIEVIQSYLNHLRTNPNAIPAQPFFHALLIYPFLLNKKDSYFSNWHLCWAHKNLFHSPQKWNEVLERPLMVSNSDLRFHHAHYKTPWPLEQALLKYFHFVTQEWKTESTLSTPWTRTSHALYWVSEKPMPGLYTIEAMLPASMLFDHPDSENLRHSLPKSHFLKTLTLYADSKTNPPKGNHPIQQKNHEEFLRKYQEQVDDVFLELLNSLPTKYATKENYLFWMHELWRWGAFKDLVDQPRKAVSSPLQSANGLALLHIEDFGSPYLGTPILLGTEISRDEYLKSLSQNQKLHPLLPAPALDFFEIEGLSLPDLNSELEVFEERIKNTPLFFKKPSPPQVMATELAPKPTVIELKKFTNEFTLSASSLESFAQCPQKFYFKHLCKPQELKTWDPDSLNAAERGSLLHSLMEALRKHKDFPFLSESHLSEVTKDLAKDIKNSLISQTAQKRNEFYLNFYAQELLKHLQEFEQPLWKLLKPQNYLVEEGFECSSEHFRFRGAWDRVDWINDKCVLLWDYKSGALPKTTKTQFDKGKLQWFLYAWSFEQKHPGVRVFGGYLRLFDLKESLVFLPPEEDLSSFGLSSLPEILKGVGIEKPTVLNQKLVGEFHDRFQSLQLEIRESLKSDAFYPAPLTESLCQFCEAATACARPFLGEEVRHG